VRRFLAHYRPAFGIVLETEIWPRLLEECARAEVPVVLANGRLSARSARRYARFPALTRWAFDAGFLDAFLDGGDAAEWLRRGVRCGTLSTRAAGALAGLPERKEL